MLNYYLYRHIRLDNLETFYIGIGKVPTSKKVKGFNTRYSRAFEKTKRSNFWKNIISKTNYKVEILLESDDQEYIKNSETILINFFGRKDLNTGTLVNHTDGGENVLNCKKNFNIAINQYDLEGNFIKTWSQLKHIEEQLGILKTNIVKCCKYKQKMAYGYIWRYTNDNNISFDKIDKSFLRKTIMVYDLNSNFLGMFKTFREASSHFKEPWVFRNSSYRRNIKNLKYIIKIIYE